MVAKMREQGHDVLLYRYEISKATKRLRQQTAAFMDALAFFLPLEGVESDGIGSSSSRHGDRFEVLFNVGAGGSGGMTFKDTMRQNDISFSYLMW